MMTSTSINLCGYNSKIWDDNLSWNNTCGFDLSVCFQETILLWIPVAFITIVAPCDLILNRVRLTRASLKYFNKIKRLNVFEYTISLIILFLCMIELGLNVTRRNHEPSYASSMMIHWLSPALMSYAIVCSLIISLLYKSIGLTNSGMLFIFWFLLTLKTVFTTVSVLRWEWQNFIPSKSSINYSDTIETIHLKNHDKFNDHCVANWDDYFGLINYHNNAFKWVQFKVFIGPLVLVQLILASLQKFNLQSDVTSDEYEALHSDETSLKKTLKIDTSSASVAPILSWLTFHWFNKIISLGYRRRLDHADLVPHALDFKLITNEQLFNKNLRNTIESALMARKSRIAIVDEIRQNLRRPVINGHEQEFLIKQLDSRLNPIDFDDLLHKSKASGADVVNQLESVEQKSKYVNLFWITMKTFKWQFLRSLGLRLLSTFFQFTIPFILNRHINFLTKATGNEPIWHGWFYIFGLVVANFLRTLLDIHESYLLTRMTIDMTNCMRLAIYKKTINLSLLGKRNLNSGTIINMLAIDVERVIGFIRAIDVFIISPLRIIIAISLLSTFFGVASLGSLPVIMLMFPYNAIVAQIMRPIVVNSINLKDFRMKIVTELFNAIKIIKIYAWEKSFLSRINKIRTQEAYYIKVDGILMTFQMLQYTFFPTILMIIVFSLYLYTGSSSSGGGIFDLLSGNQNVQNQSTSHPFGLTNEHILTANRIFVGTTLFSVITGEINSLSHPMSSFFMFIVALRRLNCFMEREERPNSEVEDDNQSTSDYEDEEGDKDYAIRSQETTNAIHFSQAHFRWDSKTDFELKAIDLSIPKGLLVAIVGRVGSGKSSLLSAMLGDIELIGGHLNIDKRSNIGYVCQEAWILNDTIVNNICLGQSFNQAKYDKIIEACALQPDFDTFPHGDQSEIGEKGLNLSGGQKQRIALARAIYLDANIVLLDDPLSAVDAHIGKHLFERVISNDNGLLANKTRVLVTNKLSVLPNIDYIYTMDQGSIIESGTCLQLLKNKSHFAKLYASQLAGDNQEDEDNDGEQMRVVLTDKEEKLVKEEIKKLEKLAKIKQKLKRSSTKETDKIKATILDEDSGEEAGADDDDTASHQAVQLMLRRQRRNAITNLQDDTLSLASIATSIKTDRLASILDESNRNNTLLQRAEAQNRNLTEQENIETEISAKSRSELYWMIIKTIGFRGSISILFIIASSILMVGSNVWLARWSNDSSESSSELKQHSSTNMRMIMLIVFRVGDCVTEFIGICLLGLAFIKLSIQIHESALSKILDAPMSWFDRTPIGRLLNIFSNDVEIVDDQVRMSVISLIGTVTHILASFVLISLGSYYTILIAIPIIAVYVATYLFYIPTSRQLERINLATSAPIYSHFNETLDGLTTIRAFKLSQNFSLQLRSKLDNNNVSRYLYSASLNWFDIRLQALSLLIVFSVSSISILEMGSTTAGMAAMTITYAISMAPSFGRLIELWSSFQTDLVSVERIRQYAKVSSENLLYGQRPDQGDFAVVVVVDKNNDDRSPLLMADSFELTRKWPESGTIEFESYSARYRPELDLVLNKLSLKIEGGEKVGIVGRTGAGKSSIMLAIFRVFEAAEGRILIDNVDISQMDLRYLRSCISIIPQDPVLFTGCIRQNIDPTEEHTDTEIWSVIKLAHLHTFVGNLPKGLDQEVNEAGSNFSVGQKQLFCLARAIMRRSKILLLDEATAAVDMMTDDLIQKTIRREFADSTILTVAHRLETIMDYDRVVVIDEGRAVEANSPTSLLKNKQSRFYALAKEDGIV